MPLIIPLSATPSQRVTVGLGDQTCKIDVYQLSTGLYVNLYVNDSLIIGGVIAEDRNRIVRDAYLGFDGDLAFVDQQGTDDPVYTGLGGRFPLMYFTATEIAALV